jgi:hypothetical protein
MFRNRSACPLSGQRPRASFAGAENQRLQYHLRLRPEACATSMPSHQLDRLCIHLSVLSLELCHIATTGTGGHGFKAQQFSLWTGGTLRSRGACCVLVWMLHCSCWLLL